jgi:hypothetical protein
MGTNPYRVSKWPIGTNLNRGREPPVGNGPIAWLGGTQVAEREMQHGGRHDRRGPTSHATLFRTPP